VRGRQLWKEAEPFARDAPLQFGQEGSTPPAPTASDTVPSTGVSDAQSAYALPELRALGLHEYFDPVIISGDYGYRKPDARLFQKALDPLQVRPNQAIFIGNDRYRDIFGVRRLGTNPTPA
jgi:HAD superfamily hydrolase (TIGR01509 family)